jgi:hypothetical protein
MAGPSPYNRKLKARNDRRKARSRGGRTASEAGLGKSMAASGRPVSRTNQRVPRPAQTRSPAAVRVKRNPLATPEVESAVQRLRQKFSTSMKVNERRGEVRQRRADLDTAAVQATGLARADEFVSQANKPLTKPAAEATRAIESVRKGTRLNPDNKTVKKFAGRKVEGKLPADAVVRAARDKTLRPAKGNRVTTPEVRRVKKQAKRVRKKIAKVERGAGARVDGPLTQGQKKFVRAFSKRTGINPRVAGAWVLSEMSDSFAKRREAEGNHNWLNINYNDSGPGPITKDAAWSNPRSAAKASAEFLKGKRWGAGANIPSILPRSRGASDEEQIQAIAESGWASSGYEGGDSLRRTRDLISASSANPKAKQRLKQLRGRAKQIDKRAKELGVEGVTRPKPKIAEPKQAGGHWAGSQRIIQRLLRAGPDLADDKEDRGGSGSYHDLSNETAYAQDIPIDGALEQGEPVYDQKLLDKITRRIRKMGGQIPDLTMGMGYTKGSLRGYELEIIPDSRTNSHGTGPHLHIGARWTGENLPPGTQAGGPGGSDGGGGGDAPSGGGGTTVTSIGPSGTQTVQYKGNKKNLREILYELGFRVTPGGVSKVGGGRAFAVGSKSKSSEGRVLKALKREYGP